MTPRDLCVAPHRAASDDERPPSTSKRLALVGGIQPGETSGVLHDGVRTELAVPHYLTDTYAWAYLSPANVRFLDRPLVVSAILWGNYRRLLRAALAELHPGQRVYQPACVYGDFSAEVAKALGPSGHLDIADIVPLQVENCRRKLKAASNASVHIWDARDKRPETYDVACSFFLLHEMPEPCKHQTVDALLAVVEPGGKAVFVDYHRPHWAHPLKAVMSVVFNTLEPFAKGLWLNEISSYGSRSGDFTWSKQTYFGGLYQKVVAQRR